MIASIIQDIETELFNHMGFTIEHKNNTQSNEIGLMEVSLIDENQSDPDEQFNKEDWRIENKFK